MNKITITYKFLLENGEEENVTISNVSEAAEDQDIITLANEIIAGNTKLKGQKLLKLTSCKKSILSESEISI